MSSWDCLVCGEVNPCSKTVCRSCGAEWNTWRRKLTPEEAAHGSK